MEKLIKKRKPYPGITLSNSAITRRFPELVTFLNKAGVTNFDFDYYNNKLYVSDISEPEKDLLQRELRKSGFSVSSGFLLFKSPFVLFLISLSLTSILYSARHSFDFFRTGFGSITVVIILYILFWLHSGWYALKSLMHKRLDTALFLLIAITVSLVLTFFERQSMLFHEFILLTATLVLFSFFIDVISTVLLLYARKKKHLPKPVFSDSENLVVYNPDNSTYDFSVKKSDIVSGDILRFEPGNIVPTDVKILTGSAVVQPFSFAPEKDSHNVGIHDIILSGSKILEGNIKGYALAPVERSFYQSLQRRIILTRRMIWLDTRLDHLSLFFVWMGFSVLLCTLASLTGVSFIESCLIFISIMVVFGVIPLAFDRRMILDTLFIQSLKKSVLICRYSVFNKLALVKNIFFDELAMIKSGSLQVDAYKIVTNKYSDDDFKRLVFSIFKFSSDPVAMCIKRSWRPAKDFRLKNQKSDKLHEWLATDDHNVYKAVTAMQSENETLTSHDLFILKNEVLIGCINFTFKLKQGVRQAIDYFGREKIVLGFIQTYSLQTLNKLKELLGIKQVIPQPELSTDGTPTLFVFDSKQDFSFSPNNTSVTTAAAESTEDLQQKRDVLFLNNSPLRLSYIYELSRAFHRFQFVRNLLLGFFSVIILLMLMLRYIDPIQLILLTGIFYLSVCCFTYIFSCFLKRIKTE